LSGIAKQGRTNALLRSDWLRSACAPAPTGRETLDFLDQLPLRKLGPYLAGRLKRKFLG
jgi:hypothetical protein